jgi:hypothetical protein
MDGQELAAMTTVDADVLRDERSAAWAGLAFVALSTLWAVVVTIVEQPQLSQGTTQDFANFYADQSNRISLILASLSLALAGFALLWLLGGLRNVLRKAERMGGTLSTASVVSGTILGGLLFVFNAINVAVAWALEESDNFRLDPGSAQLFEGLSYLLAIEGAFVAAVFVGAASEVLRRSGVYPAWLTWGGLVIAALNFLLAFPFHGVSLVLVLPWLCAVSLVMLRRPAPAS